MKRLLQNLGSGAGGGLGRSLRPMCCPSAAEVGRRADHAPRKGSTVYCEDLHGLSTRIEPAQGAQLPPRSRSTTDYCRLLLDPRRALKLALQGDVLTVQTPGKLCHVLGMNEGDWGPGMLPCTVTHQ